LPQSHLTLSFVRFPVPDFVPFDFEEVWMFELVDARGGMMVGSPNYHQVYTAGKLQKFAKSIFG
jgi:hypothetical protein